MSCAVIVTNLEYMLIVYVVIERFSGIREWAPAGSFPVNTGLGLPCHLGLEHSSVTYEWQIRKISMVSA